MRPKPRPRVVYLSPGREARRRLAFDAVWEARDGDPALRLRRIEELVDLHYRLHAEQQAEAGYMPSTVGGCIAVLQVAEGILRVIGGGCIAGNPPPAIEERSKR